MSKVKAPDVPQPKRGLTDFERKIADILFTKTSTNELQVERVLDVAIAIGEGLMKDAVDGRVEEPECFLWRVISDDLTGEFVVKNKLQDGDKVKLILAKED